MPPRRFFRSSIVLLGLLLSGLSYAQATRTWISSTGDDINLCSRTAPCKTFPGAISKTVAGGIIDVLDPGQYGAVTITKSITLENVGNVAGILVAGTNGITVNDFTGTAVVVLRGLSLDGGPPGSNSLNGVRFISGSELIVERSDIGNFTGGDPNGFGISFEPPSSSTLVVRDCTIHNNGVAGTSGGGIRIVPGGLGSAKVVLDNVRIANNGGTGILIQGPTILSLRESLVGTTMGDGIMVLGTTGAAIVTLDRVTISSNNGTGLAAQSTGALINVSDSTITGNLQGLQAAGGGGIVSFGNNRNFGNTVNGSPTTTGTTQ